MGAGETKSAEARVPAAGAIKRLCGQFKGRGGDVSGRASSDVIPIKCVVYYWVFLPERIIWTTEFLYQQFMVWYTYTGRGKVVVKLYDIYLS